MKKLGHRILRFPLTKIIIGFLVIAGFAGATEAGLGKLLENALSNKDLSDLISAIISSAVGIACYWAIFKLYEKRKITEIGTSGIGKNLLTGIALGFTLMSSTTLVIYLSGSYKIVAVNAVTHLLPALAMATSSAILEEILFRGVLFRIVEEKLGSYISLVISALVFGLLHLMNPNSSLLIGIGLAIQAGLLLGVLYMYSRNLWLPIAVHFAWNFTLGGVWGAPVSGMLLEKSLITSSFQGNELITGGSFGPEGSIQATLFCLVATTLILMMCYRQNKIQKPFWAK
jgi:membrane protease YdiL (CAAX protease family)